MIYWSNRYCCIVKIWIYITNCEAIEYMYILSTLKPSLKKKKKKLFLKNYPKFTYKRGSHSKKILLFSWDINY